MAKARRITAVYKKKRRIGKGIFFLLNLVLLMLLAFLVYPSLQYGSLGGILADSWSLRFLYGAFLFAVFVSAAFVLSLKDETFHRNLFLSFAAGFLLLEGCFRLLLPDSAHQGKAFRRPMPYVMFAGTPGAEVEDPEPMGAERPEDRRYRLDAMGFRNERPLAKKKPAGETRVFVLGGSASFLGSPLSNTIPGRLERLFAENGRPDVKVYNFSMVSYVSGQELSLLTHELVDYAPDLVVTYDGGNDVLEPLDYDPRPGYPYDFLAHESGLRMVREAPGALQALSLLLHRSRLVRVLFRHALTDRVADIERLRRESGYRSGDWEREIVSDYAANAEKMCRLAGAFDFRLAVFLQPLRYLNSDRIRSPYAERQYGRISGVLEFLDGVYGPRGARPVRGRCSFADFGKVFEGYGRDPFWDHIHVDNEANRYVAGRIHDFIRERRLLPPRR